MPVCVCENLQLQCMHMLNIRSGPRSGAGCRHCWVCIVFCWISVLGVTHGACVRAGGGDGDSELERTGKDTFVAPLTCNYLPSAIIQVQP